VEKNERGGECCTLWNRKDRENRGRTGKKKGKLVKEDKEEPERKGRMGTSTGSDRLTEQLGKKKSTVKTREARNCAALSRKKRANN